MTKRLATDGIRQGEKFAGKSCIEYGERSLPGGLQRTVLNRKTLTSEIKRIAGLKEPLKDRMVEIRHLIEQYFKFDGNEESLNANLP